MATVEPSERELQALKVIWQRETATVREICDAINAGGEQLAYTTVLSLLQVMEQKGLIGHQVQGKVYSYFAKVEQAAVYRRLAGGFLESVFDGALDQYVLHALGGRRITAAELEQLEKVVAEARQRMRRNSKEKS